MERVYTRLDEFLKLGSVPSYLLFDFLREMELTLPCSADDFEIKCTLETIYMCQHMSAHTCYEIVKNERLYDYLIARRVNPGYFMIVVTAYSCATYNLSLDYISACDNPKKENGQEVFNTLCRMLITAFEVFYA